MRLDFLKARFEEFEKKNSDMYDWVKSSFTKLDRVYPEAAAEDD